MNKFWINIHGKSLFRRVYIILTKSKLFWYSYLLLNNTLTLVCYVTFFFAGIVETWCGKKCVYWRNGEWNSGWKTLCCWLDVVALAACCLLVGLYNHSLYSLIALSLACFVHIFGVGRCDFVCLNRCIKGKKLLYFGSEWWCGVLLIRI